jgi:Uma2 family endonuclease
MRGSFATDLLSSSMGMSSNWSPTLLVKGHRCALAGIVDYWIVNLVDRQLEVYRNPGPDPDRPGRYRYADVTIVPADGQITPLAKSDMQIAVADLLP